MKDTKLLKNLLSFDTVAGKVTEFLPGYETPLKILLAVAISSQRRFPAMIWMLFVDVPSSGKTDLVRLIKDAPNTYYLDNLTQNAFISGERATKSNKVHDLLPLLDDKSFIVKDWTSIFSLDEKATKKILGDLVNIYDKEFIKFSSSRGLIPYESYFSHLGCVTPATLNKHTNYLNMIGARFLFYNLPVTTQENEKTSREQIFSGRDRGVAEQEARLYVSSYLEQLCGIKWEIQPLSKEAEEYLWIGAKLVAQCRGIVSIKAVKFTTDEGTERTTYEVDFWQTEKHWRALLQLKALAESLAFVVWKDDVGVEQLEIIKEVVLASMPADRSNALRIVQHHGGTITAKTLADSSEKSYKTARRLLEELVALNVLNKIQGSGSMSADYIINPEFKEFICLSTTEFLSTYSCGTETPHGVQNGEIQPVVTDQNLGETSPWQQYILHQSVGELDNEHLLEMLKFSKDYSIGETIPMEYRKKFYAQALEIEHECKKRGIY